MLFYFYRLFFATDVHEDIKIKSPANFFMEWIKQFCGWIHHFSISLTLVVLQRQKSLPDIGGTTIQDVVGHLD